MKCTVSVILVCVLCACRVTQSCLTLHILMDCSPPGSSVHGILQSRILEWVASPSSGESYQPRDQTQVYLHYRQIFFFTNGVIQIIAPNHLPPRSVKKLPSIKLVPGAKTLGTSALEDKFF